MRSRQRRIRSYMEAQSETHKNLLVRLEEIFALLGRCPQGYKMRSAAMALVWGTRL